MTLMMMEELRHTVIPQSDWNTAKALHNILQLPTCITDAQSVSLYVTLSLIVYLFDSLHRSCNTRIGSSDPVLQLMAQKMKKLLE